MPVAAEGREKDKIVRLAPLEQLLQPHVHMFELLHMHILQPDHHVFAPGGGHEQTLRSVPADTSFIGGARTLLGVAAVSENSCGSIADCLDDGIVGDPWREYQGVLHDK